MANVEGLQKTLEYIKENPAEWGQMRWSTCVAGTSLRVLKGAVFGLSECGCCGRDLLLEGERLLSYEISEMARDVLGLTKRQASWLFDSYNDLDDLERIVAEIAAKEQVSA